MPITHIAVAVIISSFAFETMSNSTILPFLRPTNKNLKKSTLLGIAFTLTVGLQSCYPG